MSYTTRLPRSTEEQTNDKQIWIMDVIQVAFDPKCLAAK